MTYVKYSQTFVKRRPPLGPQNRDHEKGVNRRSSILPRGLQICSIGNVGCRDCLKVESTAWPG